MTRITNPPSVATPASTLTRLAWMLLITATLYLCYFHNLGTLGLIGPDEPRYSWIARDMVESGDWITPRLYGKPWFEKPVLYYWGAALCFKSFGVSETTARLPSAFSALLATLAAAWLAWRLYAAETARWLLRLLPTTVAMVGFSHAAATDMPFSAMLTVAMVFAARLLRLPAIMNSLLQNSPAPLSTSPTRSSFWSPLGFGFFLGLAALAKGPAAIVLPGGAIFFWAVFTKSWRDAFRCFHPIAIASFCLTALPWYVLCVLRNPDFLRVFLIEHNFVRYLTPEFQHVRPFWYYGPILLIAFVPWTLVLCWSALYGFVRYLPAQRRLSPTTIFLLCWSVFCILFFSFSKSKLPGYILPAVPPIAVLLASSYTRTSRRDADKTFLWLLWGFAFLGIPLALALLLLGRHPIASSHITAQAVSSAGWILLCFATANAFLTIRKQFDAQPFTAAILCVVPILALLVLFRPLATPWLRGDPSGRTLAADLSTSHIPNDRIFVSRAMRRSQQFSLSFYLHHEVANWDPAEPKVGYLIVRDRGSCYSLVHPPWICAGDPVELKSSGWFVYQIKREDSGEGLGGLDRGAGHRPDGGR